MFRWNWIGVSLSNSYNLSWFIWNNKVKNWRVKLNFFHFSGMYCGKGWDWSSVELTNPSSCWVRDIRCVKSEYVCVCVWERERGRERERERERKKEGETGRENVLANWCFALARDDNTVSASQDNNHTFCQVREYFDASEKQAFQRNPNQRFAPRHFSGIKMGTTDFWWYTKVYSLICHSFHDKVALLGPLRQDRG